MSGVKVAVRVRPFNQREKDLNAVCCIKMDGPTTSIVDVEGGAAPRDFAFDYSFWSHDGGVEREDGYVASSAGSPYADQQQVFETLGIEILNNAWEGYHCCLFAYGQTGAGKSYSMVGYGANKGIVPISCNEIFRRIRSNDNPLKKYEVTVSMLEIYNEKVQDLLIKPSARPAAGLKIRESGSVGVFVDGLSKHPVDSYEAIDKKLEEGTANRTVGSTLMNATSSRAHTVLQIEFKQLEIVDGKGTQKLSVINLVDLAGSEKAGQTGATGDRLKEGCAINQSLSALGNVISALADKAMGKKVPVVPYRNSCLTRILQNALGGNSKTVMICALSPASSNYEETLSTLRYADRAKKIKNNAQVNESPQDKLIRELREENEKLRKLLEGKMSGEEGAEALDAIRANQIALEDMTKTWDEKLAEAQERDAKEGEGEVAMDMSLPHLWNLNEDPQLTGRLVHVLKNPVMRVGRKDVEDVPDILLAGLGIHRRHCSLNTEGGVVKLIPTPEGSKNTFVNGYKVEGPATLYHGDRIIFGSNSVFLFKYPSKADEHSDRLPRPISEMDWEFAQKEYTTVQGLTKNIDEKNAEIELEETRKQEEMERKLKEIEVAAKREKEEAEAAMAQQRAEFERKLKEMEERMKGTNDSDLIQQKELAEKEQRAKELEASRKQQEAEEQLAKEKKMLEQVEQERKKKSRQRKKLEASLANVLPLVKEASMIAGELDKNVTFQTKLVTVVPSGVNLSPLEELQNMSVETKIEVVSTDDNCVWLWSIDKFESRLYLMKDLLEAYFEDAQSLNSLPKDQDPFWDPPESQLLGRAHVYLKPLSYMIDVTGEVAVVNYQGKKEGVLSVNLIPTSPDGDSEPDIDDDFEGPEQLLGKRFDFRVEIPFADKLNPAFCKDVFVRYTFFLEDEPRETALFAGISTNPKWNYKQQITIPSVTESFVKYLEKDAITFEVYGQPDPNQVHLAAPSLNARRPSIRPPTASDIKSPDSRRSVAVPRSPLGASRSDELPKSPLGLSNSNGNSNGDGNGNKKPVKISVTAAESLPAPIPEAVEPVVDTDPNAALASQMLQMQEMMKTMALMQQTAASPTTPMTPQMQQLMLNQLMLTQMGLASPLASPLLPQSALHSPMLPVANGSHAVTVASGQRPLDEQKSTSIVASGDVHTVGVVGVGVGGHKKSKACTIL
eukprot:GILJ01006518.1.p1 GENE.GILJ01006518.1~~GILJ01006518.1.p1  ORF type:complete len:1181 (-),score=265.27 GILJ01006518.1:214-3756(-)